MPWDQAWAMWLMCAALLIFLFSGPARANRKQASRRRHGLPVNAMDAWRRK